MYDRQKSEKAGEKAFVLYMNNTNSISYLINLITAKTPQYNFECYTNFFKNLKYENNVHLYLPSTKLQYKT